MDVSSSKQQEAIHLSRFACSGMLLWNAGGGMEKGWSFTRPLSKSLPNSPDRTYTYLMVPEDSPEAVWDLNRSADFPMRVQEAMDARR